VRVQCVISGDAVTCVAKQGRLAGTPASRGRAKRDAFCVKSSKIGDFRTFASPNRPRSLRSGPAGLLPRTQDRNRAANFLHHWRPSRVRHMCLSHGSERELDLRLSLLGADPREGGCRVPAAVHRRSDLRCRMAVSIFRVCARVCACVDKVQRRCRARRVRARC
jgi:hypothetical protein